MRGKIIPGKGGVTPETEKKIAILEKKADAFARRKTNLGLPVHGQGREMAGGDCLVGESLFGEGTTHESVGATVKKKKRKYPKRLGGVWFEGGCCMNR